MAGRSLPNSIVWRINTKTLELDFISLDVEELLGVPVARFREPGFWPSVVHPEDRERTVQAVALAAAGEAVQDFEYRVKRADGRLAWFRTVARRTGSADELLGVTFDETSRRRSDALIAGDLKILQMLVAGRPLPEVLETLVGVVEEMADGMVGSVLRIEDGRLRHLASSRLPAEYLRAIDGQAIGPEAGSCGTAAFLARPVIVEDIATDPLWARYKDVALKHGLRACWSIPIQSADRTVLGTFALYYREPRRPLPDLLDLASHSAHLAAVAIERHDREEALRLSQAHLSLIHGHVDDGLFQIQLEAGGDYRFASVNPAFCRITGLEGKDVVGRSVRDVPGLDLKKFDEAIRLNRTVRWEETSRYPAGRRVGEIALTPVLDGESRPQFLVGSLHHVTEGRRLEEENRQLQKLDALGRLTGGVAHDFNNLLSVILGYADMLMKRPSDAPVPREDLQEIVDAGRRAADLTRQLLAFARRQALQPRRLDLNAVVTGLQSLLRRLIPANIAIDYALAPSLDPVLADPGQIEQVIMNLALNARDAQAGRVTIRTENAVLDAEQARAHPEVVPGPHVLLTLTDDGCGMSPEVQERIFEPFFTTKTFGKGTGLGLASVYGIVRQSGGHIWVESETGRGATFRVYLPRAQRMTEIVRPSPASAVPRDGGEKILLVEDEAPVRSLCAKLLRGLNYHVTAVERAEEAVAAVANGLQPDLLLTDLVLPDENGAVLAGRLRKKVPGLRVMFMSGYSDTTLEETDVVLLQKPFTAATLGQGVRAALDGQ